MNHTVVMLTDESGDVSSAFLHVLSYLTVAQHLTCMCNDPPSWALHDSVDAMSSLNLTMQEASWAAMLPQIPPLNVTIYAIGRMQFTF